MKRFLLFCGVLFLLSRVIAQTQLNHQQIAVTQDVDFGNFGVAAAWMESKSSGPSRIFLTMGPAPTNTSTGKGEVFDAVLFLDVDGGFKILKKDGTISTIALR